MGLDQYAYRVPKMYKIDAFHFSKEMPEDEFFYLRKNYLVDDFMQNLYVAKGGKEEFNCKYVEVTEEDIDKFSKMLGNRNSIIEQERQRIKDMESIYEELGVKIQLKDTSYEDVEEALEFIEACYNVLKDDELIYYSNWW